MLSGVSSHAAAPAIEPETGLARRLTHADEAYCPWLFSTWSQADEILGRFCCRQARMVKSPWSITERQCFCTSREQAFCSSGVPLRCWAKASDETADDNKERTRK